MVMEIEKKFAQTDLNVFEQAPIDAFAKGICKYRLFNVTSAMPLISHIGFKESSAKMIFSVLSKYLITGNKTNANIGKHLYEAVDKYKYSCPALTPTESQKRRVLNKTKQNKKEITKPVLEIPEESKKLTEQLPTNYGIKIGNVIKLFIDKNCCDAYMEAYKEFNKDIEYEVVKLKYKTLED